MTYLVALSPRSADSGLVLPLSCLDTSYVKDRLVTMRKQEDHTSYKCIDYLRATKELCSRFDRPVDEECRRKMCEWCYRVVDHFGTSRETVEVAMSYLDRYLSTKEGQVTLTDRKLFQLTSMTTLYMANKIDNSADIRPSFLADLSRGSYTKDQILNSELNILNALKWRLSGPTSLNFIHHFITFIPATVHKSVTKAIEDYARFQTEIAVTEYKFTSIDSSCIAFASVLNALECIDDARFSLRTKHEFVCSMEQYCCDLMFENLEDIKSSLFSLHRNGGALSTTAKLSQDESRNIARLSKLRISTNSKKDGSSPVSIVRGQPEDSPVLAGEVLT